MMNQEDIFKKVGQILGELQDQYEFLARNPSQLNELELELFLANANFLTDHVHIVKKINSNKPLKAITEHIAVPPPPVVETAASKPEITPQKTLNELAAEYAASNEEEPAFKFQFRLDEEPPTDKFEFEEQSGAAIFDRPLSKEEEAIIAEKQKLNARSSQEPAAEEPKPQPIPEPSVQERQPDPVPQAWATDKVSEKVVAEVAAESVVDKVEEKVVQQQEEIPAKRTLNEMFRSKTNALANTKEEHNKPSIANLKQAINLNQKLLFIKDLFNGYNLAYAEAIDLIDKMPDFKSVDTFLKYNYAVKNNWSAKQSTVDQFYELLNQRFPAK